MSQNTLRWRRGGTCCRKPRVLFPESKRVLRTQNLASDVDCERVPEENALRRVGELNPPCPDLKPEHLDALKLLLNHSEAASEDYRHSKVIPICNDYLETLHLCLIALV